MLCEIVGDGGRAGRPQGRGRAGVRPAGRMASGQAVSRDKHGAKSRVYTRRSGELASDRAGGLYEVPGGDQVDGLPPEII